MNDQAPYSVENKIKIGQRADFFFAAFHQEFNSNMNIIVMHILFI